MSEIITDQNKEFRNYTTLSNLIDELDLSPLAIAIYFHYKRWANAEYKNQSGVKDLMKKYRVGSASIAKAKQELVDNKLVKIDESGRSKGIPDDIKIIDIVKRNFTYFDKKDPLLDSNSTRYQSVTRPVINQGLDPLLDSNAIRKKKEEKEKEEKTTTTRNGIPVNAEYAERLETMLEWMLVESKELQLPYEKEYPKAIEALWNAGFSDAELKKYFAALVADPKINCITPNILLRNVKSFRNGNGQPKKSSGIIW